MLWSCCESLRLAGCLVVALAREVVFFACASSVLGGLLATDPVHQGAATGGQVDVLLVQVVDGLAELGDGVVDDVRASETLARLELVDASSGRPCGARRDLRGGLRLDAGAGDGDGGVDAADGGVERAGRVDLVLDWCCWS